jgi:hypothetical protein
MSDLSRLQRLSTLLYWVALALSVVLPLVVLFYAALGLQDPTALLPHLPFAVDGADITHRQAGLIAVTALVAVMPLVAALRAMAALFRRYGGGEVLSEANAETILQIGRMLVLVAGLTVAVPTVQGLIVTWNAAERQLAIGIDGGTLGFLMVSGLLTVIGWAMREAARVKAENEGFV